MIFLMHLIFKLPYMLTILICIYLITIYMSSKSQIKQEVNKISNWMLYNKLSINYKKSCFILVTKKPINSFNFKVSIHHNHIQKTEYVKYLGIYVDNKLSWKVQIDKLCSKISKVRYALQIEIFCSFVYSEDCLLFCVSFSLAIFSAKLGKIFKELSSTTKNSPKQCFKSNSFPSETISYNFALLQSQHFKT